jgi:RND superfamily putative drug exporter
MRTLAGWCVKHRWMVVLFWLVALFVSQGLATVAHSAYSNSFSFAKTQSSDAIALLKASAPKSSGDIEQVVYAAKSGTLPTDSLPASVQTAMDKVEKLPHVGGVSAPTVDAKGTVGFVNVTFDEQANDISNTEAKHFVAVARTGDSSTVAVNVTGQLAEFADRMSFSSTGLGVVLALIVLLLVFGSIYAAILPILSALFALGTAIGIVELLSHVIGMPQFAPILVALIGLGVGVDYALFIVTRHRQGLVAGRSPEDSIVNAVNTSGRAVLFAGIIVCIALLGMFALGVSFLYGLAVAAAIGVLFTMVAALTFLPAMLGFIGPKVMSRKQKKYLAENGPRIVGADSKGFWPNWADRVQARPVISAVGALIVIGVLIVPFFSLRLGSADQGSDPAGSTTRIAYDDLAKGFGPGYAGPLEIVAKVNNQSQVAVFDQAVQKISEQSDVRSPRPGQAAHNAVHLLPSKDGGQVAVVSVYPNSSPQAKTTTDLISQLRNVVVPRAVAGSGVTILIGGQTAIYVDFAHVLSAKLPLFIGLVVLLSFLLLAIVFRSIVIPLTGAVMNLLSIGAAFGIVVAVFQNGVAGALVGIGSNGPVEAFIPVMLFAILFGLSMDYQVFLVSRMHEEYIKSGDNRVAVRNGLAATGKTITAAALIMILVFASFVLGGERVIKEFGIGLAGGVLVDAVLIRMCVVPSVMMLFGKANWYFPARLNRMLPKLSVDADDLAAAAVPVGAAAQAR